MYDKTKSKRKQFSSVMFAVPLMASVEKKCLPEDIIIFVYPLLADVPILHSLKTLENQRFFSNFLKEYIMGTLSRNIYHIPSDINSSRNYIPSK